MFFLAICKDINIIFSKFMKIKPETLPIVMNLVTHFKRQ